MGAEQEIVSFFLHPNLGPWMGWAGPIGKLGNGWSLLALAGGSRDTRFALSLNAHDRRQQCAHHTVEGILVRLINLALRYWC